MNIRGVPRLKLAGLTAQNTAYAISACDVAAHIAILNCCTGSIRGRICRIAAASYTANEFTGSFDFAHEGAVGKLIGSHALSLLTGHSSNEILPIYVCITNAVRHCPVKQARKGTVIAANALFSIPTDLNILFGGAVSNIYNICARGKAAQETAFFDDRTGFYGDIDNIDRVGAARGIAAASANTVDSIIAIIDSIIADERIVFQMWSFDRKILNRCFTNVLKERLIGILGIGQCMVTAIQCTGEHIPALSFGTVVAVANGVPGSIKRNILREKQISIGKIISTIHIFAQFFEVCLACKLPRRCFCTITGEIDFVRTTGISVVYVDINSAISVFRKVPTIVQIKNGYVAVPFLSTDCVFCAGRVAWQIRFCSIVFRSPVITNDHFPAFDQFFKMWFKCNIYCKRRYIRIAFLIVEAGCVTFE